MSAGVEPDAARAIPVHGPDLPLLDAPTYRCHPVHATDRIWTETNCYVDLWIEVLHALGAEPLAVAAFTLSGDFEGPQWSFFKPPAEDLEALFGVRVTELNVWCPVIEHITEQRDRRRLLTVEVDSWWLPDTAGVSYRRQHAKTTIVPYAVDRRAATLGYFHGSGYHSLEGDDFEGLFATGGLPPYTELVRLEGFVAHPPDLRDRSRERARHHLRRAPRDNPATRLGAAVADAVTWLRAQDLDTFHAWAFGTCRQFGANAELAAAYCAWLAEGDGPLLAQAAGHLRSAAEHAKALEFALARIARGRQVDITSLTGAMAESWAAGLRCAAEALAR